MEKTLKKFAGVLCAVFIALAFLLPSSGSAPVRADSASGLNFDNTNVLDDLKSSKDFNLVNYPFDSTGIVKHPEVMNVVEYCYTFKVNMQDNYGLYLYFYNPQGLNINGKSKSNKVEIAVSYSKDKDGNDIANSYEKFDLQFCSVSTEPNYYRLFYKFKVIDRKGTDEKTILQRLNSNARRYDISGIELHTSGNANATEYTVGGTYTFTGYAKGYGADSNAESNLTCDVRDLETVRLDLAGKEDGVDKRTYWRSNSSSLGKNHQNQINSVFFAIDKTVLEKYGYILQKIKAEWWEYKTRPAVVLDDQTIYKKLLEFKGKNINTTHDQTRGYKLSYREKTIAGPPIEEILGWSWNYELGYNSDKTMLFRSNDIETLLPLLFDTKGVPVQDYTLSAETLQEYFKTYNQSFDRGHLIINGGHDYSADLFEVKVDEGRTIGKNEHVFDIGNPNDFWDIRSYDSTHNWWQKLNDYGFGGKITTDDDFKDISPIQMIEPTDLNVSDLSTHLKINPNDVNRFKDYYNSVKKDCEVFIFRYAATDYFAKDLDIWDYINNKHNFKSAELRQGTQFFDFDILEFTFNKDGVYTVIPVVSSPIDHWSDFTPSIDPKPNNWWAILLIVLVIVVILIILFFVLLFNAPAILMGLGKVLLWILKAIGYVIASPVLLVVWIVKKVKARKVVKNKYPKRITASVAATKNNYPTKTQSTTKKPRPRKKAGWADTKAYPHARHPAYYKKDGKDDIDYVTFTHAKEVDLNGKKVQGIPLKTNIDKSGKDKRITHVLPNVYKGKRSALGKEENKYRLTGEDKKTVEKVFKSSPKVNVPKTGGTKLRIRQKEKPRKK